MLMIKADNRIENKRFSWVKKKGKKEKKEKYLEEWMKKEKWATEKKQTNSKNVQTKAV